MLPRLAPWTATLLALGLLCVVGVGDYVTGWFLIVDFFYLIPLALTVLYVGRRSGLLMALACAATETGIIVVQMRAPGSGLVPFHHLASVWNFAMRLGVQSAFVLLLAQLSDQLCAQRRLIADLRAAHDEVKALGDLLPICAWCKRIRDDGGYWQQLDRYFQAHELATFTHSICPDCLERVKAENHHRAHPR